MRLDFGFRPFRFLNFVLKPAQELIAYLLLFYVDIILRILYRLSKFPRNSYTCLTYTRIGMHNLTHKSSIQWNIGFVLYANDEWEFWSVNGGGEGH